MHSDQFRVSAVLTFKHVILSIIPYSTIMYVYFLIKLVAVVFNKSLSVSERAETDPIVGLHIAKNGGVRHM